MPFVGNAQKPSSSTNSVCSTTSKCQRRGESSCGVSCLPMSSCRAPQYNQWSLAITCELAKSAFRRMRSNRELSNVVYLRQCRQMLTIIRVFSWSHKSIAQAALADATRAFDRTVATDTNHRHSELLVRRRRCTAQCARVECRRRCRRLRVVRTAFSTATVVLIRRQRRGSRRR